MWTMLREEAGLTILMNADTGQSDPFALSYVLPSWKLSISVDP